MISQTIFAFHKLPLRVYLAAIAIFTNAVKGISALQMARDLGVQHKSAYILIHKHREALMVARDETPLSGDVHVDGAYVGGSVRPENRKEDRIDRRLAENQNPDKRCVLVMRENYTAEERKQGFQGAKRTLAMVIVKETQAAPTLPAENVSARHGRRQLCADERPLRTHLREGPALGRVAHRLPARLNQHEANKPYLGIGLRNV